MKIFKRVIYLFSWFCLLFIYKQTVCQQKDTGKFILVSRGTMKPIYLPKDEPNYVKLAVKDLIGDVEKITGQKLLLIDNLNKCKNGCIVIGSMNLKESSLIMKKFSDEVNSMKGKWEAYLVKSSGENLIISGSDEHGTMYGIYDFIEKYLKVDPLYFWSDREPKKRNALKWNKVYIHQKSPTFKYRGWFINDEDILSEWFNSKGRRNINYPYYSQVMNPKIMEHIVESLLRLRMNLIIPASFIDILNPPEAQLVKVAAKRGLFTSMHHIEPMGVSAFSFFNYWENKTGKKPTFSFYSNKKKIEQVWQVYAKEWNKYPNVIWQIGLRGIGDRPMWQADSSVPHSSEERGRIISEAMQVQMNLIKKIDKRPSPPVTTTLWSEGSMLNDKGYLKIPENVTIVFSDNSPGWKWQDDFYHTKRSKKNTYGIYYHEALWGSGPHLAQVISPKHTYTVINDAYRTKAAEYAILNVSNVRTFLLGEAASAQMLYSFESFDPDKFEKNWMRERFGIHADEVEKFYDDYFSGFVLKKEGDGPMLMDGQIKSYAMSFLKKIQQQITDSINFKAGKGKARQSSLLLEKAIKQRDHHLGVLHTARKVLPSMDTESQDFLKTNLISQLKIMIGLEDWLIHIIEAKNSINMINLSKAKKYLALAKEDFKIIDEGKKLNTKGEKWEYWYRGDKKINLPGCEKLTRDVFTLISQ